MTDPFSKNQLQRKLAIPFSEAARPENFYQPRIEGTGCQDVVQNRDNILSLNRVEQHMATSFSTTEPNPDETLQTAVYSNGESNYGLVVESIQDNAFVIATRIQHPNM